jgi:A-macroglobulin receptor binding domain
VYFDDVDTNKMTLDFKAVRTHNVAELKPASVLIYDYYDNCKWLTEVILKLVLNNFFLQHEKHQLSITHHKLLLEKSLTKFNHKFNNLSFFNNHVKLHMQ